MRQTAILSFLMLLLSFSSAKAEDIIGKWEGGSSFGDSITYEFKEDNSVIWVVHRSTFPGPITARYSVDYSTKPIHLDMFDFTFEPLKDIKFIGIVEFLSPTKMKMDGIRVEAGGSRERPKEFTKDTIEFNKVEPVSGESIP